MDRNYIKEWKENELTLSLKYYEEILDKYNQMLNETKMAYEYYNNSRYFAEKEGVDEKDIIKRYHELYEKEQEFIGSYGSSLSILGKFTYQDKEKSGYIQYDKENEFYKCYLVQYTFDKEKAIKVLTEIIDKHFKKLQAKVENKIGTITNIYKLNGDNYNFIGQKGECGVRVILAGGYNIQKLHTRWIVTKTNY